MNDKTLRRPVGLAESQIEFHLGKVNFHVGNCEEATQALSRAIDEGDLAEALAIVDHLAESPDTARAELIRYAIESRQMTMHDVVDACEFMSPAKVKTLMKYASDNWDRLQTSIADLNDTAKETPRASHPRYAQSGQSQRSPGRA